MMLIHQKRCSIPTTPLSVKLSPFLLFQSLVLRLSIVNTDFVHC
nr:MAG TPA: hypothetical protein [Caudoviricetes sp.]